MLNHLKSIIRPGFGVCSTQTLVEIYNTWVRISQTKVAPNHLTSSLPVNAINSTITTVVFFNQLSGSAHWSKHFFLAVFNLYCSFQTFFSDFSAEINKKRLKKNKNNIFFVFLLNPQSWLTCKSWSPPWTFFKVFVCFRLISVFFC